MQNPVLLREGGGGEILHVVMKTASVSIVRLCIHSAAAAVEFCQVVSFVLFGFFFSAD